MIALSPTLVALHLCALAIAAPASFQAGASGTLITTATTTASGAEATTPVNKDYWCDLETEVCYPNPQDSFPWSQTKQIKRSESAGEVPKVDKDFFYLIKDSEPVGEVPIAEKFFYLLKRSDSAGEVPKVDEDFFSLIKRSEPAGEVPKVDEDFFYLIKDSESAGAIPTNKDY